MIFIKTGGAEGNRTPDLLNAIQALSQLSYNPNVIENVILIRDKFLYFKSFFTIIVKKYQLIIFILLDRKEKLFIIKENFGAVAQLGERMVRNH